jgi:hypothetical protein
VLADYCVGIANARGGYLLLGIEDVPPRTVVGTQAFLNIPHIEHYLFQELGFQVSLEPVDYSGLRVLVCHIPSRRPGVPYRRKDGRYWIRVGNSLVGMTPDQLVRIFDENRKSPNINRWLLGAVVSLFLVTGGLSLEVRKLISRSVRSETVQSHVSEERHLNGPDGVNETQTPTPDKKSEDLATHRKNHAKSLEGETSATPITGPKISPAPQSPPVDRTPPPQSSSVPATFLERLTAQNGRMTEGDRNRLSNLLHDFVQSLDEGSDIDRKASSELSLVNVDASIADDYKKRITELYAIENASWQYQKDLMSLETKSQYYHENFEFVFGDNPHNLGPNKLINAMSALRNDLDAWGSAVTDKSSQASMYLLSEAKSKFEAQLTEYNQWNGGCRQRLAAIRESIK